MNITVNDVRDGVIGKLDELYPDVKVTGEEIQQGLGSRRFFVKILTAGHTKELGRRYRRVHSFDVHYFGPTNEELHSRAETLYGGLEYITVPGGITRGTRMRHEIVNEVLHFFVDYDFRVIQEKSAGTKMRTLKQEANVKNG